MLDRNPGKSMADLKNALPKTWSSPTMAPHCADEIKYGIVDRVISISESESTDAKVAGQKIRELITVNGARDAGRRDLGPCARLVQQAGTRRRGESPTSEANESDLQGPRYGAVRCLK
jgi:hypothetical protein